YRPYPSSPPLVLSKRNAAYHMERIAAHVKGREILEQLGQEEAMNCEVCESILTFRWSDTHGVGVCMKCGAPYTVIHYEGDKRIDKPPEIALNESGVEIAKRYWNEKGRRVFPAAFDMGF